MHSPITEFRASNRIAAIDGLRALAVGIVVYVLSKRRNIRAQLVIAVCAYSALVQLVSLGFATHAVYSVPYKAYLFNN
jgi:ABC-type iron transport system FetAB permease component